MTILTFSCARKEYFPPPEAQTGLASWYGPKFHGKTTSSQEIYNMYDMTAAHKTLPFGTQVMVTNLNNGKSVTVKINDRGPFIEGRIIDLSYAAAQMLDMVGKGVVPVRLEILRDITPIDTEQEFSVQVGAFIHQKNAQGLKDKLQKKYKDVYVSKFETPQQIYYRVRIRAQDSESAKKIARQLIQEGYKVFLAEGQ